MTKTGERNIIRFAKEHSRALILVAIILAGVLLSLHFDLEQRFSFEWTRDLIRSNGAWGPLLFMLTYCASSLVLFPATLLSTVSGAIWGPYWGTVYTVVSATIASCIPFLIARLFGRRTARAMIESNKATSICDRFIGKNGFAAVLMMRLIPFFPWDMVNFGSGLCGIRFRDYLLASLLGTIPASFTYNLIGASVGEPLDKTKVVIVAVLAVMIGMVIVGRKMFSRRGKYDYDVVVIGAGSGGLVACKLANGLGKKTALIEKRKIGGDCAWFGCVPSKTLIKSAYMAHQTSRLREFGLEPSGQVELNANKVMAHVRAVVQADADGHPPEVIEAEGIDVLFGAVKFLDSHRLKVGEKVISAKKFVICTGSHPFIPPIEGLADVPYLTNETIFDLDALPKSMIVLGGGPIGVELSAALNRLGVEVTVLQRHAHILPKEDPELVERLEQTLHGEGLNILTKTQTNQFCLSNGKITAEIEDKEGDRQITADALLVAVGRRPNLEGLALENAGVQFDERGLKVDRNLRTTTKNIYAAGDIVPPYLFTHIAEYEAIVATTNACFGLPLRKANYTNVLWATYTDPELAHAGLTEAEARNRFGDSIRVYRWEHKDVDRAKTDLATNGLTKVVCDKRGRILGIHIFGHGAAELMHELQLAKSLGVKFSKVAGVIHAYPSYSDAVRQPAKRCYVDLLQNHPLLRLFRKIKGRK